MKLIDLDKVRWTEGFYDMHTGEQYASMMLNTQEWLEWATAEAKVEAIPIEWMKNYARKICADDAGRYNSKAYGIDRMIYDWEKENETN